MTVFRALVGKDLAWNPDGETRFRDFRDGLSNTIMVVEADASEAIPWTSPEPMELDMQDPISQMGHIHPGGFHVLLADGAVRFIAHAIAPNVLAALFTKSGGEIPVINP
jgi:prepilin-type processing-associated H-X9-DG protein